VDSGSSPSPDDSPRVLVVDDEKVIREILSDFLTMEGYVVRAVEDGSAALKELRLRPYDLVISDLKMPNMGGLELLEKIAENNLDVLTIIMTGFGTVETAIEAMKKGAYDYILKPVQGRGGGPTSFQRGLDRAAAAGREHPVCARRCSLYRVSEAIAASPRARPHPRRDHGLGDAGGARRRGHPAPAAAKSQVYEERIKRVSPESEVGRRRAGHARYARAAQPLPGGPAGGAPTASRRRASSPAGSTASGWCRSVGADEDPRPGHRFSQRLQLHPRQEVRRGPAQDARHPGAPRRDRRSRTRASTRTCVDKNATSVA
jgi:CheY-like chemotaxis protein